MRYRLRTLLILMAVLPVVIWGCWLAYDAFARAVTRAWIDPVDVQPATFPNDAFNIPIEQATGPPPTP